MADPQKHKLNLRLILLGCTQVGKTCLVDRLIGKTFTTHVATNSPASHRMKYDKKELADEVGGKDQRSVEIADTITLFDSVGQVHPGNMGQVANYCGRADGVMLVGDVTNPFTFYYRESDDDYQFGLDHGWIAKGDPAWGYGLNNRWLPTLLKGAGKIPIVIVGNKNDGNALKDQNTIDASRSRSLYLREIFGMKDVPYFLTSAQTGAGVTDAFYDLLSKAYLAQRDKEKAFNVLRNPTLSNLLQCIDTLFDFYFNGDSTKFYLSKPITANAVKTAYNKKHIQGHRVSLPGLKAYAKDLGDYLKQVKTLSNSQRFKGDCDRAVSIYLFLLKRKGATRVLVRTPKQPGKALPDGRPVRGAIGPSRKPKALPDRRPVRGALMPSKRPREPKALMPSKRRKKRKEK